MTFRQLSWHEINVLAYQFGYYKKLVPFCRCSTLSPNLPSVEPNHASPYAGVPRAQWKPAGRTPNSNA